MWPSGARLACSRTVASGTMFRLILSLQTFPWSVSDVTEPRFGEGPPFSEDARACRQ